MKIAIVVVGYNRLNSIKRLLKSLDRAVIDGIDSLDLVFDLDHADTNDVIDYANAYNWRYGEKKVRSYDMRLGLRTHMMEIGRFWFQYYDALVVLEDDVYVSPFFYSYVKASVEKYVFEDEICGIALYARFNNEHERKLFPLKTEYDNYFMKKPCSWGQVWLKKQWMEFYKWYERRKADDLLDIDMPRCIKDYPSSSYLKYFTAYMVERDKYFSYPYVGYTTCFADAGEHAKTDIIHCQTELMLMPKSNFELAQLSKGVRYDVYDESEYLSDELEKRLGERVTIDIYGEREIKRIETRFLLSHRVYDYEIVESYGAKLKPLEANVLLGERGQDLLLYDLSKEAKNNIKMDEYKWETYDMGFKSEEKGTVFLLFKGYIERWIRYRRKALFPPQGK